MNKLYLKNFKSFENELEILAPDSCNILVYGENGSGKSSIYEAIKFVFYKDRLIPPNLIGMEKTQKILEIKDSYKNQKNSNSDFTIKINDIEYDEFPIANYEVFMISNTELDYRSELDILDILANVFFPNENIRNFLTPESVELIIDNVNQTLKEYFFDNISIQLVQGSNSRLMMIDNERSLAREKQINFYFNEAKIKIVILLILFSTIIVMKKPTFRHIIVLDDIINSFDASNRTFLISYIMQKFADLNTQLIILTHNTSYYNLFQFSINNIFQNQKNWQFINLYETTFSTQYLSYNSMTSIADLDDLIKNGNIAPHEVGNRLRQHFEILIHEIAKILHVGTIEEITYIIEKLIKNENIYLCSSGKKIKTVYDLIHEIDYTLFNTNDEYKIDKLKNKINFYKMNNELKVIKNEVQQLKLLQKVILHPMSHGSIGLVTLSSKEINACITVLKKMEEVVSKFKEKNVYIV